MSFSFRLTTIFYVMALLAAALAAFGAWGTLAAVFVFAIWMWVRLNNKSAILAVGILVSVPLIAALFVIGFPQVGSSKPSVRNDCLAHLKDIALALQNYHDDYGTFPPAYLVDAKGVPAHSWRVLILPYLEEPLLYKAYNFSEPWNGPNNRKLVDRIPYEYRCAGIPGNEEPNCTTVFAIVGDRAAWRGDRPRALSEFTDGPSETILIMENCAKHVNWMDPTDISYDEALQQLTTATYAGHRNGEYSYSDCNVGFANGHVKWLWPHDKRANATALLTIDARDEVDMDSLYNEADARIRWRGYPTYFRFISPALFIAIALLPALPRCTSDRSRQD